MEKNFQNKRDFVLAEKARSDMITKQKNSSGVCQERYYDRGAGFKSNLLQQAGQLQQVKGKTAEEVKQPGFCFWDTVEYAVYCHGIVERYQHWS